jgi:hypothetical protein
MEMSQGNPLYSYLTQTKMSFFFFYKIGEKEGRIDPVWKAGSGEDVGKECRRLNMVKILCAHAYKWKTETCWTLTRTVNIEKIIK